MNREQMLTALREKLDAGYQTFMAETVMQSPQMVFESAATIHYNQQAYDELYNGDCLDDSQLEQLLQYRDPLQIAREQWEFWSEGILWGDTDMTKEMSFAIQGFLDDEFSGAEYARDDQSQPDEPEMSM